MSLIYKSTHQVISKYGKNAIFTQTNEGSYNENTLTFDNSNSVNHSIKAYCSEPSYSEKQNPFVINHFALKFLLSGFELSELQVEPKVGDFITYESNKYKCLVVQKVQKGNITLLWKLLCVKS